MKGFFSKYGSLVLAGALLASVGVSSVVMRDASKASPSVRVAQSPIFEENAALWRARALERAQAISQNDSGQGEKILEGTSEEIKYPLPTPSQLAPVVQLALPSPARRTWTDEEIFRLQHPEYYIDYLGKLQDVMTQNGFLKNADKVAFSNEDDILSFFREKVFDFMVGAKIASEEERERFNTSLALIKSLHIEEARLLKGESSATEEAPYKAASPKNAIISFFTEFLASRAEAQTCFQPGANNPVMGVNLAAPCCACTVLGAPIGCLNLMCVGRPAIFDQTTFICGCG
jgi:hypothetical protein